MLAVRYSFFGEWRMIPFDVFVPYFIACLILAIAPGPDNIFVLTQAALRGRKAGILIVLGLCVGLLVHTTGVSLGVAVIFKTSALAFTLLKLAGAAYLIYLAWGAFRAGTTDIEGEKSSLTHAQLFRRGIIMNVTNPKVAIFFLAFLPQFADPARGPISFQMLLLGVIFIISAILVFGAIALAAGTLGEWLKRSESVQKYMNRAAGVIFLGLAARLLLAERS
jgi:threonine/homoserine/homoserine lactone efflux protein